MQLPGNREIKRLEKLAQQQFALRVRAKKLTDRADENKRTLSGEIELLIVSLARGHGITNCSPSAIVLGMQELAAKLKNDTLTAMDINRGQNDHPNTPAILLFVSIGRKTAPDKMKLLKRHLRWNGRKGGWTGEVYPAALEEFRQLFDANQLSVEGGQGGVMRSEVNPSLVLEATDGGPASEGEFERADQGGCEVATRRDAGSEA